MSAAAPTVSCPWVPPASPPHWILKNIYRSSSALWIGSMAAFRLLPVPAVTQLPKPYTRHRKQKPPVLMPVCWLRPTTTDQPKRDCFGIFRPLPTQHLSPSFYTTCHLAQAVT